MSCEFMSGMVAVWAVASPAVLPLVFVAGLSVGHVTSDFFKRRIELAHDYRMAQLAREDKLIELEREK